MSVASLTPAPPARAAVVQTTRRLASGHRTAVIGIAVLGVWALVSLFAPVLAPYDPLAQNIADRLREPSAEHLFGTDQLGRDVLSRVLYGGRISLVVGLVVVSVATVIGGIVGAVAGFGPAWLDNLLMRLTEIVMGFPIIILAMAIAAALGAGFVNALIALVLVSWPRYARIVRALVLTVKRNEYVVAARAVGVRDREILWRTILPNCVGPAVVMASLDFGTTILTFSGLSFLGLGSPPPTPEWGSMVAAGAAAFEQWWIATFSGLAILSVALACNFTGDGLRDFLDPRLRYG